MRLLTLLTKSSTANSFHSFSNDGKDRFKLELGCENSFIQQKLSKCCYLKINLIKILIQNFTTTKYKLKLSHKIKFKSIKKIFEIDYG